MRILIVVSVFIFISIGLLIGCSVIYDISYDFDRTTDFSSLKSYSWLATPEKSNMNNLDKKRIKLAVNSVLKTKGFENKFHNPDFLIAYHLGTKDKVDVRTWGYGYGPHGRYWGGYWGNGGVSVYQYEEGTLIIDFVDSNSKNLLWRGAAKSVIDDAKTPEKRDSIIYEAVYQILKNFPPTK
jgi:hypothetical protein